MLYYLLFFFSSIFAFIANFKFKNIFVIILIVFLALFAGTRLDVDNDYMFYLKLFKYVPDNAKDFLNDEKKIEWCMYVIPNTLNFFVNSKLEMIRGSFLIFAFLGVSIKLFAIKKYSPFFFLSIIIYLSYLFIMQEMTTIRAGVASAIFLLSLDDIDNRNYKSFFLKILLCLFFHSSSLVFIIAFFIIYYKISIKYLYVGLCICFLLAVSKVNFLTLLYLDRIFPKVQVYLEMMEWMKEKETNIFNFRILFALFFTGVLGFYYSKFKDVKFFDSLFKLHVISLCFFFILSPSAHVFSIRTFELFSVIQIILYPMIVFLFEPRSKFIGWTFIILFSIVQIVYLIDVVDIYKPYKSWLFY
ncbi:EpsG family protein [Chryseobacterium echinoideorum]|uniref:EpsG family protein n=1 Tax=Chryseobacterium echinoideorum TaxID=1549648 RepID=UPI001186AD30|nr:EpsG family protein [Chryseobacterium echinoideorum]